VWVSCVRQQPRRRVGPHLSDVFRKAGGGMKGQLLLPVLECHGGDLSYAPPEAATYSRCRKSSSPAIPHSSICLNHPSFTAGKKFPAHLLEFSLGLQGISRIEQVGARGLHLLVELLTASAFGVLGFWVWALLWILASDGCVS